MTRANGQNTVHLNPISPAVTAAVAAVAAAAALAPPAWAVDFHWNSSNADWSGAGNWNPINLPGPSDRAFVDFTASGNPGVVNISTDTLPNPLSVRILNANRMQVKAFGSLGVSQDLIVGADRSSGTLSLINANPQLAFSGRLTVGDTLRIGTNGGVGTISHNDGTVPVNQMLRIADTNDPSVTSAVAAGTYNLSGFGVLNT